MKITNRLGSDVKNCSKYLINDELINKITVNKTTFIMISNVIYLSVIYFLLIKIDSPKLFPKINIKNLNTNNNLKKYK